MVCLLMRSFTPSKKCMNQIEKFLKKLEKKLALQLAEVLQNIIVLNIKQYDVKKMKGFQDFYRIRVGKIRIIFSKSGQKHGLPIYIEYRGKVYKKL